MNNRVANAPVSSQKCIYFVFYSQDEDLLVLKTKPLKSLKICLYIEMMFCSIQTRSDWNIYLRKIKTRRNRQTPSRKKEVPHEVSRTLVWHLYYNTLPPKEKNGFSASCAFSRLLEISVCLDGKGSWLEIKKQLAPSQLKTGGSHLYYIIAIKAYNFCLKGGRFPSAGRRGKKQKKRLKPL